MKKIKRTLALIGAILLILMYASTLLFAFIDTSTSKSLLWASLGCTFLLPVMLYAFTLVYKVTDHTSEDAEENEEEELH